MKVVRENQGGSSSMVRDQSFYISTIYSYRRGWGDRIREDDPARPISLRGRLL